MDVVETQTSALSQSLVSQSLLASMDPAESKKPAQYDSVKMRYFLSLGMNRPPPQLSSSVPTHSYMANVSTLESSPKVSMNIPTKPVSRQRTKTAPSPKSDDSYDPNDIRKRTTSVPIPIGFTTEIPISSISASVGTYLAPASFDSEEDDQDDDRSNLNTSFNSIGKEDKEYNEEDIFGEEEYIVSSDSDRSGLVIKPSDSPIKFIPPHEMMANSKKDFNVGTAHSVAVWEQRRRKFI